jgi:murein DD-endopeptidase MepM/ murein hydrolase activator NlpD
LGAPTSEEKNLGGNIVQYFEHGHIYWNGSKATAYDEGTGLPSLSLPSNQPISGKGVTIRTGDSGSSGNITLIGGGVRGFEDRDVDGRNNFYPDSVLDLHPANHKDTPSTPNQPWDNPSELTENPMFRELMSYLVGNKVAAETLKKPPINVLTSGYLDRYYDDRFLGYYFHSGFDMGISDGYDAIKGYGAKVSALTGGKVISAGTSTENAVAIHNADLGKTFLYLHMRNVQVKKGQNIDPGTWIGNVSDKGTPGAIHLHFEVHEDQELQELMGNPYAFKDGVVANPDKENVRARTLNPLNAFMEAQLTGKTVVSVS